MRTIKPYKKHKPSGIAWLGDIPEHWQISKAKHILFQKKKTLNPDLNCGSISFGNIVYKDNDRVPVETKATYQELLKGEFLINPLNLNFDLKSLRTGLSNIDVVVSTGYIVLQNNPNFNKRYLKWLLHQFDISFMKTLGDGVRQTLSYTDFKNTGLPYISLDEQTAIAHFLDYKTAKIDRFIRKKKQIIKLLNEQKAGIINHAVTKGLDPNATMKDSGIKWLGDIPEHWEVVKLNGVCSFVRGNSSFKKDELLSTGKYVALQYGKTYKVNEVDKKYQFYVNDEFYKVSQIVNYGDVIFISTSETIEDLGHSVFYNRSDLGLLGGEQIVLKPNNAIVNGKYLCYSSKIFAKELQKYATGVKVFRFNINDLKTIYTSVPPTQEQTAIVSHIEKETSKLNKTISTIEKEIALTQEYRTALIAEAVTGKIDVRTFVIPTVSPQEELYEELEEELDLVAEDTESFENE
jgi:type I restriction enzyme S subunit